VLAPLIGVKAACEAVSMPRSSLYRERRPVAQVAAAERPARSTPARALSEREKMVVLELLNGERFQDQAPREVYATLLDEEQYLCHWRTMYRVLAENAEIRERRNQLRHPVYAKPELLATEPCQVWSWDISKLRGPQKGHYYYLYVILDIFSRYVVGWMIAEVELAELAKQLIAETCAKQGVERGQLTIHADNGGPMTAKSVALLMADLGVVKSHSRPYQSNDNPYSEAHFKTLKYRPDYPDRFGSLADARAWASQFFAWYNHEHHHSDLALLTPFDVHYGWTDLVLAQRQTVLHQAYASHPERFVQGVPEPARPPEAAWINPPKVEDPAEPENLVPAVPSA
jgi:putative transposase